LTSFRRGSALTLRSEHHGSVEASVQYVTPERWLACPTEKGGP
jgi:hypothetical protein